MPSCWDSSLEVFALPYRSCLDCCLVGENINGEDDTVRLPSPEEFAVMEKKLQKSLGPNYKATMEAV